MKWLKLGNVFTPNKNIWWQQYYGILPTPIYLEEIQCIRIFFASTCENKYGRISFVDVDINNPCKILYTHSNYILDIGEIGAFDDCGVNPSAIIRIKENWFLYYAGYQRHHRSPYSIFSGLAISTDGKNFNRLQKVPILERTSSELNLRSAPTVIFEKDIFKMWYVSDFGWRVINSTIFQNKLMPQYCLKYAESIDGIEWKSGNEPVLTPVDGEFGFGRPYIFKQQGVYSLFYSIRRENQSYRIGFAESIDGVIWARKDKEIGIDISDEGWDSEMICYPAVITVKDKTYLFYNGNNNGETGFGVAELIH